jgi:hypothetical protein
MKRLTITVAAAPIAICIKPRAVAIPARSRNGWIAAAIAAT